MHYFFKSKENEKKKENSKKINLDVIAPEEKARKEADVLARLNILKSERKIDELERRLDFKKTFDATVIGSFTFVAGLFWRDVADSFIKLFLPQWSGLIGTGLTAIIVTTAFVFIAVRANSRSKKLEKEIAESKEKLDEEKLKLNSSKEEVPQTN